jgi:organic radical activating enzyme
MNTQNKIIKITSSLPIVDWHFGDWCQNECSYCPPNLHANSTVKYSLDLLLKFTNELEKRFKGPIYFIFSGGEPTIQGNFGSYVKLLKERNHYISAMSNGGRTLRWWDDNAKYFDRISLSFHTEFSNIEHFKNVATILDNHKKTTSIILICWPDNMNIVKQAYDEFIKLKNTNVIVKKIERSWIKKPGVIAREYTGEEEDWINTRVMSGQTYESPIPVELKVYDSQSNFKVINPYLIRNISNNRFKGWNCFQGVKNLAITVDGTIYGAHCQQLKLGSVYDIDNIQWPTAPSICQQNLCTCNTDMIINKDAN